MAISNIKTVIYDAEQSQYIILSNKYNEKLGFFVIKMNELYPQQYKFLIKCKNKLDIGDTYMVILKDQKFGYKELIISYKTNYINVYNITVMDITTDSDNLKIFRHESFQLWESECAGMLLRDAKDFIHINKEGMHVTSMGIVEKRALIDSNQIDRTLHSLESVNYLKVDKSNYIVFECADDNEKYISI